MPDTETLAPIAETPVTPPPVHPEQPVSIDLGDRVLTGAGETEESLREGLGELPAAPKPSRGQKRFDQLTKQREDAERQAAAVAEERDRYKAELDALRQQARPTPPTGTADVSPASRAPVGPPVAPAASAPAAFTFPTFEQYSAQHPGAAYEDWLDAKEDARTDYKLQQFNLDARIRSSIEADRATRSLREHVSASETKARQAYPDFDAVRQAPHMQVEWPAEKLFAIAQLEDPAAVQYALGKNPELAERLRTEASPVTFGLLLARLIPSSAVASPASTASVGIPVPPSPMQPVGSGSKTSVPSAADLAERGGEDYDASGFREQARRERGRVR